MKKSRGLYLTFLILISATFTNLYSRAEIQIPHQLYEKHIEQKITHHLCSKAFKHCIKHGYFECQMPHNHCQLLHNTATISAFLSFRFNQGVNQKKKEFSNAKQKESTLAYCRYLIKEAPLDKKIKDFFEQQLKKSEKKELIVKIPIPHRGEITISKKENILELVPIEKMIKKTFAQQWKKSIFELREQEDLNPFHITETIYIN